MKQESDESETSHLPLLINQEEEHEVWNGRKAGEPIETFPKVFHSSYLSTNQEKMCYVISIKPSHVALIHLKLVWKALFSFGERTKFSR